MSIVIEIACLMQYVLRGVNGDGMKNHKTYADPDHPVVSALAHRLTSGISSDKEVFRALFRFVRNDIPFGFPPAWDKVKASETLDYGIGYCNTKTTLLVALCRAAGLEAMFHAGKIDIRIMEPIIPGWALRFLPDTGNHLWLEVNLDSEWCSVDAYILDKQYFDGARELAVVNGIDIGYGIANLAETCTGEWDGGFVQTNAVVEDHGLWEDAGEYFADNLYSPLEWWQLAPYPIMRRVANRNINNIRRLCGQKREGQRIEEELPAVQPA